ncbi:MAG TPA: nucleoside recognition domain-containing protein [Prolixibacteraceae bacterium]|nr:nucleoside recognition domain-containing protein [Prolixibacteraceae bacterium]
MTFRSRLAHCVTSALPQGMKTVIWLLKLTIPVSFGVFLLNFYGLLNVIAGWLTPLFKMIGLPGQASVVLITSIFTNIYSVIAVMATLDFGLREGTIIAVMCLISHALIVETAIQKKTGSHPVRMVLTRLSGSFIAAWMLNLILPGESTSGAENIVNKTVEFMPALTAWTSAMAITTLKIVVLANGLLILQKALDEFDLIKWILMPFRPFLKIMGLPANTGFLWMIAYTLGLSYGGAIMISQSEDGKLSREDADLLNHHIAISHSQLEDTLLFVAVGYSFAILFFTRVLLSIVYVWGRRLELQFRSNQERRLQVGSGL